jgi:hypothetical protein
MIGRARVTQFLAWLRNRYDEFLSEGEVSETSPGGDVQQASTQVPLTPIWDAWSWPGPGAQKKALHDKNQLTGPIPSSVASQGVLSVGSELRKEVR